MRSNENAFGQTLGTPVPGWSGCDLPPREPMLGEYCELHPFDAVRHTSALFEAFGRDQDARHWTYLPYGPFENFEAFLRWIESDCLTDDPLFYAILNKRSGKPLGMASYLNIVPAHGTIEVGHIHYAEEMQHTRMSTEAMYLMMRRVFDELGYRRYEWKCNALNQPSRAAAERLGFQFEGVFRQHCINKARNRDTAWYSLLDNEWPLIKPCFEKWLDKTNFDTQKNQKLSLSALVTAARKAMGESA